MTVLRMSDKAQGTGSKSLGQPFQEDVVYLFIFLGFIYLFMREEREKETQAEGEAGSVRGA